MSPAFHVGDRVLLAKYLKKLGTGLSEAYKKYGFKKIDLSFLTDSSSVFSSNIEGNRTDLNSFMNYKLNNAKIKITKEIKEIEDLVKAYGFAMKNDLNEKNLLKIHTVLSEKFVSKSRQGKYREESVGVYGKFGLVYLAAPPEVVEIEMKNLFEQIAILLKIKLSLEESFYFASQIHLSFAQIHPFVDGNGRAARLLEKWFLSKFLGEKAWKVASEKFYWENRQEYYKNINLGVNYYELDNLKSLPFLLMLPKSLGGLTLN